MNVLKDLWKDKPLFITLAVGVVAVIYILWKNNQANVVAPVSATDPTAQVSTGGGGTYVQDSYSYYAPTSNSSTITNPTPTPVTAPTPTIVPVAKKGTSTAGKKDTNWWTYTVPAGATLTSLAQFAKWGSDWQKLVHYRNNLQILQAAGVNTSNPFAMVPAGTQISV